MVQAAFGEHPQVTLDTVPNGGKASALTHTLARVDAELALLDADIQINLQAARLLAGHFRDPAVAGNAKVGNHVKLLICW